MSLSEAQRIAREERRPIFLWDSTGDPSRFVESLSAAQVRAKKGGPSA